MANKKVVATIAAVATSAALLMGGTMAWQSINQTALNEASEVVNPGGRLHDDFNGTNKDIYVENFADEPIFARIRLDEYFDIRIDDGDGNVSNDIVEIVTFEVDENGDPVDSKPDWQDPSTFITHIFDQENQTDPYWTWTMGGATTYMPTFNMNKDSLRADINGTFKGDDGLYPWQEGDKDDAYDNYVDYSAPENSTKTATEYHDHDSDSIENKDADDNYILTEPYVSTKSAEHKVSQTLFGSFISMDQWKSLDDEHKVGPYWVYDADGWVYWAAPIEPGTATGLLLNGIELRTVMDDGWYYAINAVAQFITKDDLGKGTGTGFYDTEHGTEPTPAALELLKAIGVDTSSVVSAAVPDDDNTVTPEKAQQEAAANLQRAFNEGGDIKVDGTVISTEAAKPTSTASFEAGFIWTEGGTLSGGTIETTNDTNHAGLFINSEKGWPNQNDVSRPATMENITVNSAAGYAVYIQAYHSPVTLNNVNVNGEKGGIFAEYGSNTVTLDNVNVFAKNGHETKEWVNTAVAAGGGANVVINSGNYTGKYALYVYNSGGTITVNGGYFSGALKKDEGNIIIKGGTFTANPTAYVDAYAYDVIPDNVENPTIWTVQAKATEQP